MPAMSQHRIGSAMNSRLAIVALAAFVAALSVRAEEASAKPEKPKLAHGQMLKYGEKIVFSPCRDRSYIEFQDASGDGSVLRGLDEVGLSQGKKLYVELLGILDGNLLKAERINLAKTEGHCQLPGGRSEIWRAGGNEPGWVLAFGDEVVQVKRLGQADLVFPAAPLTLAPGAASYGVAKDGHRLELRFEQQACRDTMADMITGWTASVTVDGQVLKGCAWQR